MEKDCKYFGICGGCDYLTTDYNEQLNIKTEFVKNCLKNENVNVEVLKCIGMYFPYHYRNKVHLAIGEDSKGKILIGFYQENTKRIIDIDCCPLHDRWLNTLIQVLRKYLKNFKIKPFNPITNTGTIRYVVARYLDNNLMITLVCTNQNFGGKEVLYKNLTQHFKNVTMYLNINNRTDSAVFDEKFIHKFGDIKLSSKMLGLNFKLSPNSFFQINFEIANKIYKQVLSEIVQLPNCHILDLFSGIGITSMLFSKVAEKVMSIECNLSAVKDEIELLKLNNIKNVTAICDRCENRVQEIKDFLNTKNSFVFVDPARNGIEKSVLKQLVDANPRKIIYLSCNPETLARDLKVLLNSNEYKINYVQPYDMFPQTKHIETLVVLEKIN